jgi:hypothetical protein
VMSSGSWYRVALAPPDVSESYCLHLQGSLMFDTFPHLYYRGSVVIKSPHRGAQLTLKMETTFSETSG